MVEYFLDLPNYMIGEQKMTNYAKSLRSQAENLYWGRSNFEDPVCPVCKEEMQFFGDEKTPLGEGEWVCLSCGHCLSDDEIQHL